ncbi:hypothetical protein [Massilia sp. Root335]|uniref:hypothetical protein n=1 Tax=Massilia sp. Root335 TaxID=1736517 RepID=UPI000700C206|nr:hypothetical protein [Massilia sp. Root335]
MTSHPLSQWLKFMRASLPALQQAGADWPAAQAQCAQFVKSTLELGKDLGDLHGATCLALLQAQLGMLGAASPARAAQGLLDVHFDTMSQWYGQWKTLADETVTRTEACIGDLRQAQNQNDVSFVMAGFLRELDTGMRKASGDAALLFQSAGAAAGVLADRALDALIAQSAA